MKPATRHYLVIKLALLPISLHLLGVALNEADDFTFYLSQRYSNKLWFAFLPHFSVFPKW